VEFQKEGRRLRKLLVGLLLPSVQVVTEELFVQMGGEHCTFCSTRIRLRGSDAAALRAMDEDIANGLALLADTRPDLVVFSCAASGALRGPEQERSWVHSLSHTSGMRLVTPMLATLEVFRKLNIQSIDLFSPYLEEVHQAEARYLEAAGVQVLGSHALNREDGRGYADIPTSAIVQYVLDNVSSEADALFLSCMNWRGALGVAELEERVGRPVITSHSATLWKVLHDLEAGSLSTSWGRWLHLAT